MSPAVRSLVALLLSFALALNAVGAVATRGSVAGCCSGSHDAPAATQAKPPCHDEMAASLSCTLAEVAADDAPVAALECSDGCAHCFAHQGATLAVVVAVGPAQDWPMASDDVPSHRSSTLPPPRPGRLERPPSRVALA